MGPAQRKAEVDPDSIKTYAEECYIHQDTVQYADGLLAKVKATLDDGFKVLCAAYVRFTGMLTERARQ